MNMMKRMILFFSLIILLQGVFAQQKQETVYADPRIVEVFGQETVDFYLRENPRVIQYYNFFLDNAYTIAEVPQEKMQYINEVPEMKPKEKYQMEYFDYTDKGLEDLNIMKFDVKIDPNIGPIYRLGNTNKLIYFLSGKEIQEKYNQYRLENK